jgi:hypothetical protein
MAKTRKIQPIVSDDSEPINQDNTEMFVEPNIETNDVSCIQADEPIVSDDSEPIYKILKRSIFYSFGYKVNETIDYNSLIKILKNKKLIHAFEKLGIIVRLWQK